MNRRRLQGKIADQVFQERRNQEALKEKGKFTYTCADKEIRHTECFLVLGEEVGEVARAVMNRGVLATDYSDATKHLRKELIQVMAVAMAWIEKIDKEGT